MPVCLESRDRQAAPCPGHAGTLRLWHRLCRAAEAGCAWTKTDPRRGVRGHRHGISQCFGLAWKRRSRTLVEPQLQGTTMYGCWEKPSRKFSNESWRARKILVYYYQSCVWLSCCKSNSQESPGESQKHAAVLAGSVPRSLAHWDRKEQRAITNHSL